MTTIFLGMPPANIERWINDHAAPAARAATRIWWSNDESDYSDCPSNNGTFDSNCFPEGKSNSDAVKVEFGTDVTNIGDSAFEYCNSLHYVTIPNSVQNIGSCAFFYVQMANLTIPDSVRTIGNGAFSDCGSLINVTIGSSVTSIGATAFSNCYVLENVIIPDSVIDIGNIAFSECNSLTSVTITANGGNANNVK